MADVYQAFLLVSGIFTLGLVLALRWGLGRCARFPASASRPTVAVVVAARNEADNIDACLDHLSRQDYPADLVQVAVVDDASQDDTAARAERWAERVPGLLVLRSESPAFACRKKSALDVGIRATSSHLILTTDADCRPPASWISSMVECFAPEVGVAIGHAPLLQDPGPLQSLLSTQATVVSALSAGSAGLGFPLTCTGRNLAYRRAAFEQVGGFRAIGHILGGDDVLLMRRIARLTPYSVRFQADPRSHVPSRVHGSGLFRRQVRYQSKTVRAGTAALMVGLCVYIFHLALAAGPFLAWARPQLWWPFGLVLVLKALADGAFLRRAGRLLRAPVRLTRVPLLALIAIPYVVLFFALGALGPTRWK